ncbi:MAG: alpha/beta hydrolase [Actinobacteria bacterium]|nr:alpha/beta hydrolase [Actinomycetota bacterium]MCA1721451.1 alpha/beta hydrolase [Actinomycetota bacterium]
MSPGHTSLSVEIGGPVHVVDHGGPPGAPPVVCVHGLGGSHANWHDLAPLLAQTRRVLAVDLPGHGRTARAGRSAAVRPNVDLLGRLLDEVVGEPVVLLGNSMGATISVLLAAGTPERVAGLALIGLPMPRRLRERPDPALARQIALCAVPPLATRALTRRRDRLGPVGMIEATLELTTADASRVSAEVRELAASLVGAAGPDAEAAYVEAARSLGLTLARSGAYRAAVAAVDARAIVLQGALDRLVPPTSVEQLRALQPGWEVHVLDRIGHVPQIEAPAATADLLLRWLDALPARPPARELAS